MGTLALEHFDNASEIILNNLLEAVRLENVDRCRNESGVKPIGGGALRRMSPPLYDSDNAPATTAMALSNSEEPLFR
jgi:hypothetical protein